MVKKQNQKQPTKQKPLGWKAVAPSCMAGGKPVF